MNALQRVTLATVAGLCLAGLASQAQAQVDVGIGPAPVCQYGFYGEPPYLCAPYGYYGPEWFVDGGFIGAGPWGHDHLDHNFHGEHLGEPHAGIDPGHFDHGMGHVGEEGMHAGIGHEGMGGSVALAGHGESFGEHGGGFGGHGGGFGGHGGGGGGGHGGGGGGHGR